VYFRKNPISRKSRITSSGKAVFEPPQTLYDGTKPIAGESLNSFRRRAANGPRELCERNEANLGLFAALSLCAFS
jgi:hypothetical protein